ncbi:MAG TPA: FAD/NAD(P)-binding oxidoreductase [bacterium]
MNDKTVIILGAGVGGLVAANQLRQLLPREHRIILIEKNPVHAFAPSFLWLMTGDRRPEGITQAVSRLVRPGIEVIHEEVRRIDLANRHIETTAGALNYDYLIVALGAHLAPEAIPGLAAEAHSFFTFDGAGKLHQALEHFQGGKIAIVVCSLPYKCPGAPHEGAMLIADFFQRRGQRKDVGIQLITPEPQPMPVAGPELGAAVKQMLEAKGISFHPLHSLTSVAAQAGELIFAGKESIRYDLLIAIPPHRAPQVVQDAALTDGSGWIPADRATLKTNHENVYAIGDITSISIPGRWKPDVPMKLPKAGVFAHAQAEVVAHRIASEIKGLSPTAEFCGASYCMLEAGEGLAGFAFGDFFAEGAPRLELRNLGRAWHIGKVLFEKWWLAPLGIRRTVLGSALSIGARILKIPVNI